MRAATVGQACNRGPQVEFRIYGQGQGHKEDTPVILDQTHTTIDDVSRYSQLQTIPGQAAKALIPTYRYIVCPGETLDTPKKLVSLCTNDGKGVLLVRIFTEHWQESTSKSSGSVLC